MPRQSRLEGDRERVWISIGASTGRDKLERFSIFYQEKFYYSSLFKLKFLDDVIRSSYKHVFIIIH